jgi:V/A-type H+-transporting ATPase subunit I
MALMPMQKVAVLFPLSERENLISLLHEKGSVQILDLKETPLAEEVALGEPGGASDAERTAGDLKRAIEDVSEFEEKGGILGGLGGGKIMVTEEEFARIGKDFDYRGAIDEIDELEARRTELRTKRNHLEAFIDRLTPWADLDIGLEEIAPRAETAILAGELSGQRTPEALAAALAADSETFHLEVVLSTERETYLVLFYHRAEEEKVQEVLRRNDFEIHTFEGLRGIPRDLIEDARRQDSEIDRQLEKIASRGVELAGHKPKLMIAHDYFTQEARKADAQDLIGTTQRVAVMEGWIRSHEYEKLAQEVRGRIDAAEVIKIKPEKGENPPIELKNRRAVRPFEIITEMYGMPHSREVDPTPLAAPFFALFFGFCITDAGYGIVLVVLSLLLMKYLKAGHKLLWLIFAGGLTTILMGAITGGWFGLTDETIPSWLGFVASLRKSLMQFDPLKNPMIMFGLALALGFIQVTFGLLIEMIENFRQKDIMAGIFEQLTWIVLIWSALLYGASRAGVIAPGYVAGLKVSAIAAAIGIVGFTNRVSKNPVIRIGSGLYRLYGATSFLGDILSYTRLLALGLATGGIAMVINVVALMAKGIPVIGIPAMIVVLAGGHTFNIAVNALGGFVHSARLQYVEFYPKFFEGGGRPFRPFKKELKYTRLVEKA